MKVLGLIPAWKGVKRKGLWSLGGLTLVEWVIIAGHHSGLSKVVCSTDDEGVAEICELYHVPVLCRPEHLRSPNTNVTDVVKQVISEIGEPFDAVALLQATSPFVSDRVIDKAISTLDVNEDANSVQTITRSPHNHHAYNQRELKDEWFIDFRFPVEREVCYNKQLKPEFWIFGNLVITRTEAILEQNMLFARPSIGIPISQAEAVDVDEKEDIKYAEWLIKSGRIK